MQTKLSTPWFICPSRALARLFSQIQEGSLCAHVAYGHGLEDKYLILFRGNSNSLGLNFVVPMSTCVCKYMCIWICTYTHLSYVCMYVYACGHINWCNAMDTYRNQNRLFTIKTISMKSGRYMFCFVLVFKSSIELYNHLHFHPEVLHNIL